MAAPIVWVSPHLAAETRSGGDLRTHHLLRAVSQVARTTLFVVGPAGDAEALRHATGVAEVHCVPPAPGVTARARAVVRRWPVAAARAWNPRVAAQVADHVSAGARLVCDHLYTAPYGRHLPHLLQLHNAETARMRELPWPERGTDRVDRAWNRIVLASFEQRALMAAQARVVTVSHTDNELLGVEAPVVPNGAQLQPARVAPEQGTLLFIGTLDYEPNRQAVRWWAEQVWPALPVGSPPLTVVGRWGAASPAPLDRLPGVRLLGEVEDLGPALREAALAVIPLQHGGGTRLKVLEALAWSIPVVATPKALEGLDLVAGQDVAVASDPLVFAATVQRLLENRVERARIGAAGRTAVQPYSWDVVGAQFVDLLDALP